jgi:hypothetical protein
MKRTALLLTLGLCVINVHAQTIYRCGADGRAYSQSPCEGGRALETSDTRTANQQAEAVARAREAKLDGKRLERERLDAERSARPARAVALDDRRAYALASSNPVPTKHKAKPHGKKRTTRQESKNFKAIAPPVAKPARGA